MIYENGLLIKLSHSLYFHVLFLSLLHVIKVHYESSLIRLECDLLELNASFIKTFIFQKLKTVYLEFVLCIFEF